MSESSNQASAPGTRRAGETHDLIDEGGLYSKDYWDLVIEQLARRPLFKVGVAILTLIYGTAIFAPLIGNDHPLKLVAIDYSAYVKAERLLGVIGRNAIQEHERTLASGSSGEDASDALDGHLEGMQTQVAELCRFLPSGTADGLQFWAAGLTSELTGNGALPAEGSESNGEAGEENAAWPAELGRGDYASQLAAIQAHLSVTLPTSGGPLEGELALEPEVSWPLLSNLGFLSAFFMALWVLVASWPVWNRIYNQFVLGGDRERMRRARRLKFATIFGAPLAFGLLFGAVFGFGTSDLNNSPEKYALTTGDAIATEAPILAYMPYGFAETHTEEKFRPPTWLRQARLDSNGQYMVGARRPKPDLTTGYLPPPTPVETRYGEPWPNAPQRHLLGTDELGRDFFVRLLWGGRVSLVVGLLSAFLLTSIGVVMGSIAGYFGGWVDIAIMRMIEILQSIPAFFLILATVSFIPPDAISPIFAIVIVIALVRWTGTARLVRGEFLRLRDQEFVVASEALGFSNRRTIFRHVLPNAMSPVLVSAAFAVAAGILTESAVSFLGFGVQPPDASWGSLVNESKSPDFWWIQVFPGVLIFLTVTCYNLVGDAIRDALDPKMKV